MVELTTHLVGIARLSGSSNVRDLRGERAALIGDLADWIAATLTSVPATRDALMFDNLKATMNRQTHIFGLSNRRHWVDTTNENAARLR